MRRPPKSDNLGQRHESMLMTHRGSGAARRSVVQILAQLAQPLVVACALLAGCELERGDSDMPRWHLPPTESANAESPFAPLPASLGLPPHKVELGRRLFEDPRLSGGGDRSCADCHELTAGGVAPGESRSNHPLTQGGPYNVPTVFNVAFNFRFNWQGQYESLEDHLSGPMMSAQVMNVSSWESLVARLRPIYDDAFVAAGYRGGVSEVTIRDALATYQRSLVTPDSRFDRALRGELQLTPEEARGHSLFLDVGCVSCHQGVNIGGNMFQRYGVMTSPFDRPEVERDYGRMLITGEESDAYVFRVPSLRNVAITAPYFHDGSARTLEEAVQRMAWVQIGYQLSDDEVSDMVTFLQTLTGEYQGFSLATAEGGP